MRASELIEKTFGPDATAESVSLQLAHLAIDKGLHLQSSGRMDWPPYKTGKAEDTLPHFSIGTARFYSHWARLDAMRAMFVQEIQFVCAPDNELTEAREMLERDMYSKALFTDVFTQRLQEDGKPISGRLPRRVLRAIARPATIILGSSDNTPTQREARPFTPEWVIAAHLVDELVVATFDDPSFTNAEIDAVGLYS